MCLPFSVSSQSCPVRIAQGGSKNVVQVDAYGKRSQAYVIIFACLLLLEPIPRAPFICLTAEKQPTWYIHLFINLLKNNI